MCKSSWISRCAPYLVWRLEVDVGSQMWIFQMDPSAFPSGPCWVSAPQLLGESGSILSPPASDSPPRRELPLLARAVTSWQDQDGASTNQRGGAKERRGQARHPTPDRFSWFLSWLFSRFREVTSIFWVNFIISEVFHGVSLEYIDDQMYILTLIILCQCWLSKMFNRTNIKSASVLKTAIKNISIIVYYVVWILYRYRNIFCNGQISRLKGLAIRLYFWINILRIYVK